MNPNQKAISSQQRSRSAVDRRSGQQQTWSRNQCGVNGFKVLDFVGFLSSRQLVNRLADDAPTDDLNRIAPVQSPATV
jgi:hypothetical protein